MSNLLPLDYPEFYSFEDDKWYSMEEFIDEHGSAYETFMNWDYQEDNFFLLASEKFTNSKKYSLLGFEIQVIFSKRTFTYLHLSDFWIIEESNTLPVFNPQPNETAKSVLQASYIDQFQVGERWWIGKAEKISEVKKRIVAFYEGNIKGVEI